MKNEKIWKRRVQGRHTCNSGRPSARRGPRQSRKRGRNRQTASPFSWRWAPRAARGSSARGTGSPSEAACRWRRARRRGAQCARRSWRGWAWGAGAAGGGVPLDKLLEHLGRLVLRGRRCGVRLDVLHGRAGRCANKRRRKKIERKCFTWYARVARVCALTACAAQIELRRDISLEPRFMDSEYRQKLISLLKEYASAARAPLIVRCAGRRSGPATATLATSRASRTPKSSL